MKYEVKREDGEAEAV